MRSRRSAIAFVVFLAGSGGAPGTPPAAVRPGQEKAVTAPASPGNRAARALFARVVAGLGKSEKVAALRDVVVKATATVQTTQGEQKVAIVETTILPDRLRQDIDGPSGKMTSVVTPNAAFVATPAGIKDLPEATREERLRELSRSALNLARHPSDPKLSLSAAGKEKIGDVEAAVLDVDYDGAKVRWYVDPATGRIVRTRATSYARTGSAREPVTDYSDYRLVDGLFFAFRQETRLNGEKAQVVEVQEVQLNTSPDPKIFEKPAAAQPEK
jgi:hypothetical protein